MQKRIVISAALVILAAGAGEKSGSAQAAELKAFHRSGQTFVTWKEDAKLKGEWYHVLVGRKPLTAANLAAAKVVAKVPENSGQFRIMTSKSRYGARFKKLWPWFEGLWIRSVDEGGKPLPKGTGLFVRTAKENGSIHLAVQTVHDGKVVASEIFGKPIEEKVAPPAAVKMAALAKDKLEGGAYLLYMDFDEWNPDRIDDNWEGYAYPFKVSCFKSALGKALPLSVRLHAYGAHQSMDYVEKYPSSTCVNLCPLDQHLTWWFGYNDALPARKEGGKAPAPGKPVVNYTERQVLAIINWLKRGPGNFKGRVDPQRVFIFGGSMGGSGINVFGMRNGDVFAAGGSTVGFTSWAVKPQLNTWYGDVSKKWGEYQDNPKTSEGPGVYDLLNMPKWFREHPEIETPFLLIGNHITDQIIPFQSFPDFLRALEESKRPYMAGWGLGGHFGGANFYAPPVDYRLMRLDESLPALANASCNNHLKSGFRIVTKTWKKLTEKTLSIEAGSLTHRANCHENGSFPKGLAGKILILGSGKPPTWWTIKSNTATELTIEEGNLLDYKPTISSYTLGRWKAKNKNPNPTEKDLEPLRARVKKKFAICDGDPRGQRNAFFAWSSSLQNFDPKRKEDDIVDEEREWAMCIRLTKHGHFGEWKKPTATADVTPRRCQKFKPQPGEKVRWENLDMGDPANPKKIAEGEVTAGKHGLVTVPKFVIGKKGWGNRLVLKRK